MLCMKLIKENYKTLGKGPVKKKVCIIYYFFCLVGMFWCRTCSIKQYVPLMCMVCILLFVFDRIHFTGHLQRK